MFAGFDFAVLSANAGFLRNGMLLTLERIQVAPYRSRMLRIRLEDLLSEPRPTMQRVLDYVGEPWNDAVLAANLA